MEMIWWLAFCHHCVISIGLKWKWTNKNGSIPEPTPKWEITIFTTISNKNICECVNGWRNHSFYEIKSKTTHKNKTKIGNQPRVCIYNINNLQPRESPFIRFNVNVVTTSVRDCVRHKQTRAQYLYLCEMRTKYAAVMARQDKKCMPRHAHNTQYTPAIREIAHTHRHKK